MNKIKELVSEDVVDLKQYNQDIIQSYQKEAIDVYDVIIYYVLVISTELLLQAMTPENIKLTGKSIRLVQVGEKAGRSISLPASTLRTSGIEIFGGTKGMTLEAINEG